MLLEERLDHVEEELTVKIEEEHCEQSHIGNDSDADELAEELAELRDGYEMIKQVSEITGVPVLYTSGRKEMLDIFLAEGHDPKYIGTPMPIDTYMHRDWDSWIKGLDEK